MNRLLLILVFLFSCLLSSSQPGYLFVKKGYKKKKTYLEGERILFQVKDGTTYSGLITLLRNDTVWLNGRPVWRPDIKTVLLSTKNKKKFHLEPSQLLLITAGVALTTAGLTLSNQATFKEALTAGLTIGYSPLLLQYVGSKISFRRKRFRIGKKYRIQILEFHLPNKRGF